MCSCWIKKGLLTALIAAMLFMGGCGGKNVKTDYYTLRSLAQISPQTQAIANLSGQTLALGPVTLPDFITTRAQIIAAEGPNKLKLMENARWAESLDTNVMLVLADNLTYLLKPDNVLQYPWRTSAAFDLKVEVTVFTLSADHDKACLRGVFRVADSKDANALDEVIDLAIPLHEFTAAGIVAAQNQLINDASVLIAEKVLLLSGKAAF